MIEIVNHVSKRQMMRNYDKLVIYYGASWCKPCVTIAAPLLEELSKRCSDVKFVKIDVDVYEPIDEEKVNQVPIFRLYKGGQLVHEVVGATPQNITNAVSQLRNMRQPLRSIF